MPQQEEIFAWIEDLTAMGPRLPGTPGGPRAAEYVEGKLSEFGLEPVAIEQADTERWVAEEWSLAVGGRRISSYPIAHTFSTGTRGPFATPEAGLAADLVYVGEGSEGDIRRADVRGKIVVADVHFKRVFIGLARLRSHLFYDPDGTVSLFSSRLDPYSPNNFPGNYFFAQEAGAAGFIGILSDYLDRNTYNNEDYGHVFGKQMTVPGQWVSKSEGNALIASLAKADGPVRATMTLEGEVVPALGNSVVGYLRGRSSETIMVHSHHDSSTPGAVEDASGTAMVLALARFFSRIPTTERTRTLLFVTMDTHFTGYDSHEAFIERHLRGQDDVLVDVCLEHIAREIVERNGQPEFTGLVEPRVVFVSDQESLIEISKEEVLRHGLQRTIVLPANAFGEEMPTDADAFWHAGVPVISFISGPIYLYDEIDTVDKIAVEELRPVAETFADVVWRLDDLPTEDLREKRDF